MTLSRNLALSATKISADGDIDYNNLLNKPTIPSVAGLASTSYVDTSINNLVNGAPAALNTLKEIADQLAVDESATAAIVTTLGTKANTSSLSTVATTGSYNDLTNKPTVPTNTNQLTNGAGFITASDASITGKQATLVSGTNIKTVNGTSLLGSGDLVISGGGGGGGTTTSALNIGQGLTTGTYDTGDLLATIEGGTAYQNFGAAIAASDTYIAVYSNADGAYGVKVYNATTRALMYNITNPNLGGGSSTSDTFGSALSIQGNYLVVGSKNDTDSASGGSSSGSIYYYDISTFAAYSGTPITISTATWSKANPNDTGSTNSDYFGSAVKVYGNYVIASAYGDNSNAGAVYIFDRATGTKLYTIQDPNAYNSTADYFGNSLDMNGTSLVVGAYNEYSSSADYQGGRAYVFNLANFPASPATITSSNYTTYSITLNNPTTYKTWDRFGAAVAINSTYVAVGIPGDGSQEPSGGSYSGAVCVFNKTTGALVYTLYPANTVNNSYMGGVLAMNETTLLVGALNQQSNQYVYLYDLATGKCVRTYSPKSVNTYFGSSLALTSAGAYIGVYKQMVGTTTWDGGAVCLYSTKYSFNGSSEFTLTLAQSGVTPATKGASTGGNWAYVPVITADKFGRVTYLSENPVYIPSATNSFSTIQVGGTTAHTAASSTDTLNFVGTGGTTVTSSTVSGIKTITINSTSSSGTSTATPVTTSITNIMWDPAGGGAVGLQFSSTSAANTFATGIGTGTATITGYNANNVMGGFPTTFTATGTWTSTGGTWVIVNSPTLNPNLAMYLSPSGITDWQVLGAMSAGATVTYTPSSGGAAASGPVWAESTIMSNQGATNIGYTKPSTGSARIYVAFYSPSLSYMQIQPPMGMIAWSTVTGMNNGFIVFCGDISSGFAGVGETWTLSNTEHLLYTTWTVTDAASTELGEAGYAGGGMANIYTPGMYTKTHYFMVGGYNSTNAAANTSAYLGTVPSGYTFKSGKAHSLAPTTSVGLWSNPTATSGSHAFNSANGSSYNYGSLATA